MIQIPTSFRQSPQSSDKEKTKQEFEEYCSICCQYKTRGKDQIDNLRLLQLCYECWFGHVKNFVMRISYRAGDDIVSPFNQGPSIDIVRCVNSLKPKDAQQVQEALFKKYSSFTKEIQKCPSQMCDFIYIGNRCKWGSNQNIYNCPKCQMPLATNNSFSMKSIMASFYLIMANKCPKCDIPIQKISGCPHMTCPCGHHFCWYCYKDHPSGTVKRIYHLHNVPQCAFIFISKIVLFLICASSLLITFNGNWVLRYIFNILSSIFSVFFRAALLDGAVLVQIMFFMMRKRRGYQIRPYRSKKYIILTIIGNLMGIALLYFLQQLQFFFTIFVGELILAVLGFCIGYGVIYSIQTWFQFIA